MKGFWVLGLSSFAIGSLVSRDDCTDGPATTPSGLNFTVKCGYQMACCDPNYAHLSDIKTMADCLEACASVNMPCYAVDYNWGDQKCYFMNSSVVGRSPKQVDAVHWAGVSPSTQLDGDKKWAGCPDINGTTSNQSGLNFTTYCGKDMGSNMELENLGLGHSNFHADSLEECMQQCAEGHPRCLGVKFDPGLLNGFDNCYPKNSNDPKGLSDSTGSIVALVSFNATSCAPAPDYFPPGTRKSFAVECSHDSPSNAINQTHAESLAACIDACAPSEDCNAVVYDTNTQHGLQNCELKTWAATGVNSTKYDPDKIFAVLVSNSTDVDGNGWDNSSADAATKSKSKSKAWIAGPVIGGLAFIALVIAGFIFFRRRRGEAQGTVEEKRKLSDGDQNINTWQKSELDAQEPALPRQFGAAELETDTSSSGKGNYSTPPAELPANEHATELDGATPHLSGDNRMAGEGSESNTKYRY